MLKTQAGNIEQIDIIDIDFAASEGTLERLHPTLLDHLLFKTGERH